MMLEPCSPSRTTQSEVVGFVAPPLAAGLVVYSQESLRTKTQGVLEALTKLRAWPLQRFSAIPPGKLRARYLNWSDANDAQLRRTVRSADVDVILLNAKEDESTEATVELSKTTRKPVYGACDYISVRTTDLTRLGALADLGSEVFEAINGTYGCIMLDGDVARLRDRITGMSSNYLLPAEDAEVGRWYVNQSRMKDHLRGPFLVNYLNQDHVDKLGGIAHVRATPGVAQVITRKDHTMIRLTWQPGQPADDLNRAIAEFGRAIREQSADF